MDYRKLNSHLILLLAVIVISLIFATICRRFFIEEGFDLGTANLIFVAALGGCAIVYMTIIATLSHTIIPWIEKRLPAPKTKDNGHRITPENEKQEEVTGGPILKDDTPLSRCREYARLVLHEYVSADDLNRLDRYIEIYINQEPYNEIVSIRTKNLKNPDLYHFGWSIYNHVKGPKQERVAEWLKHVFIQLEDMEVSTIHKKLTMEVKCIITRDDNIRATVIKSRLPIESVE